MPGHVSTLGALSAPLFFHLLPLPRLPPGPLSPVPCFISASVIRLPFPARSPANGRPVCFAPLFSCLIPVPKPVVRRHFPRPLPALYPPQLALRPASHPAAHVTLALHSAPTPPLFPPCLPHCIRALCTQPRAPAADCTCRLVPLPVVSAPRWTAGHGDATGRSTAAPTALPPPVDLPLGPLHACNVGSDRMPGSVRRMAATQTVVCTESRDNSGTHQPAVLHLLPSPVCVQEALQAAEAGVSKWPAALVQGRRRRQAGRAASLGWPAPLLTARKQIAGRPAEYKSEVANRTEVQGGLHPADPDPAPPPPGASQGTLPATRPSFVAAVDLQKQARLAG